MSADPNDLLAVILVILAVFGWIATVILLRGARRTGWMALRERAAVSVLLTVFRTVLATFAVLHLVDADAPPAAVGVFVVLLFLAIALPDLWWLYAYLRGRFNG